MQSTLERIYVVINAAFFLAFGLGALTLPRPFSAALDISLQSPTALADFRAMYGGLCLTIGLAMLAALRRRDTTRWTVGLAAFMAAGLSTGRLVTWGLDGRPGVLIFASLASEVLTIGFASWLWFRAPPTGPLRRDLEPEARLPSPHIGGETTR